MYPTYEQAKEKLTAEQIEDAESQGTQWGSDEAGCWEDAHNENSSNPLATMPDWTLGEWCGSYQSDDENIRIAYEIVLDHAARAAWDKARELRRPIETNN